MIRPVYTLTLLFSLLTTVCAENRIADANSMSNDSIATKASGTQLYIAEEDKTDYSKFAIKPHTRGHHLGRLGDTRTPVLRRQ